MAPNWTQQIQNQEGLQSLYLDCVHCGLCLPQCPTYREWGMEADSPRGRIHLIRAVQEGKLTWTPRAAEHLDLCLGCRACETACPAGVHFGRMLEESRATIEQSLPRPIHVRWIRRLVFGHLFQSMPTLRAGFRLIRLYQRIGLQRLVRRLGLLRLLSTRLHDMEAMLPPIPPPGRALRAGQTLAPYGETRHRVAFFVGCVMNELMGEVQRATIEVLRHNGCEVWIPDGQTCCGALHFHAGEHALGMKVLQRNVDVFSALQTDGIVTNAAGCGATLKEYGVLGKGLPGLAGRAQQVADKVEDISEFLARIGCKKPEGFLGLRVAYDDPCHLIHGQKVFRQPRDLLRKIPGLVWCELPDADHCCGSAGIYNVVHFDHSMQILEKKMQAIARVKPDVVATGNPGCILQIRYGARRFGVPVQVRHPVELLAEAYDRSETRRATKT